MLSLVVHPSCVFRKSKCKNFTNISAHKNLIITPHLLGEQDSNTHHTLLKHFKQLVQNKNRSVHPIHQNRHKPTCMHNNILWPNRINRSGYCILTYLEVDIIYRLSLFLYNLKSNRYGKLPLQYDWKKDDPTINSGTWHKHTKERIEMQIYDS